MTVYGPVLIVPSTGVPTTHFGWYGMKFIMRRALAEKCVALHLFGTDFPTIYPTADAVTDYSIGDHARGPYDLTNNGATPATKSFTSSSTAYYTSPLTGDALTALGTAGQFSAFCVSKFTTANAMAIGCYNGTTLDGWGLGRVGTSGARYGLVVKYASVADPTDLTIIPTAGMGTDYDFLGATFCYDGSYQRANLYQQSPGGTLKLQNGGTAMTLPASLGGLSDIRFGRSVSATFTAAQDLVFAALFSSELSQTEVEQLQADVKDFLADYSITI